MVLKGYTDGTFKPEQSITRAEFAALLNRLLDILSSNDISASQFADVKKGAWYEKDINAAASNAQGAKIQFIRLPMKRGTEN